MAGPISHILFPMIIFRTSLFELGMLMKCSISGAFQVLSSHKWLGVTKWDRMVNVNSFKKIF